MCQALPSRVLRAEDGRAEVQLEGRLIWVSTLAVPDTAPGDYLIVYAGHALERVPEVDALTLLAALVDLGAEYSDAWMAETSAEDGEIPDDR